MHGTIAELFIYGSNSFMVLVMMEEVRRCFPTPIALELSMNISGNSPALF